MTSLFGDAASAKAVNYVALAQQGAAVLQAARAGNYAGCMPFLKARPRVAWLNSAVGTPSVQLHVHGACVAGSRK